MQRVVDLALGPPPGETIHWTGWMLTKAAGVSLRSVQRITETNADPKPFVWTADPKRVLAAVKRGKQMLESIHQLRVDVESAELQIQDTKAFSVPIESERGSVFLF